VQSSLPILVGGDTDAAIRRAVRIADGYFPGEGDAERLRGLIKRLHTEAEKADRDPSSIEINAMFGIQMADPVAGLEQMQELGVGRIMIPAFFFAGPGGLDRLAALGEQLTGQN
jgi:alkanesulfonate monooxygenase SsuD/methylene tetrahydromethanopterin reductase-like flavin-dependent oxidoreductase (luciferase family)